MVAINRLGFQDQSQYRHGLGANPTFTERDNAIGKNAQLLPGMQLRIELPENPSAGLRWSMRKNQNYDLISSEYRSLGGGIGGGGTRIFTLEVKKDQHPFSWTQDAKGQKYIFSPVSIDRLMPGEKPDAYRVSADYTLNAIINGR